MSELPILAPTQPAPVVEILGASKAAVTMPNGRRVTIERLLANGDTNSKLAKGAPQYLTVGLSRPPHTSAGVGNVCPGSSAGCRETCLTYTGRAAIWSSIALGRAAKTILWFRQREWFIAKLRREIAAAERKAAKQGQRLAVRLNVFSDIP